MNFRLRHLISLTLVSLQTMIPLVGAASYGPHPYWDADNNVYDLGGIPLRINSGVIIGSGGIALGTGSNIGNKTLDIWGITYIYGNQFIHYLPAYEAFGIGKNSLNPLSTGVNNIGIGSGALSSNTSGFNNTSLGRSTLQDNTTGNWNTAIGTWGLYKNTTGSDNTSIGSSALSSNTNGGGNTGIGSSSLAANITGGQNTGVGGYALNTNTNGATNTSLGYWSLYDNITGNWNTAVGGNAGSDTDLFGGPILGNITGWGNTFLGYRATSYSSGYYYSSAVGAFSLVTASNTITIGAVSGINGAPSDTQVVIGSGAASSGVYRLDVQKGYINTSSGLCINGDCKSAWSEIVGGSSFWSDIGGGNIAYNSGMIGIGTSNPQSILDISGTVSVYGDRFVTYLKDGYSFGIGPNALNPLMGAAGQNNIGIGIDSLSSIDGGRHNVGLGNTTLMNLTSGRYNTALGSNNLWSTSLGWNNVGVGVWSLSSNTEGTSNVGIGMNSLYSNVLGNNNSALGYNAGYNNINGNYNLYLGYYADSDLLAPNLENATAIGPFSSVAASNTMVLGSVNGVNGATADTQVVIGSGAASNSVYRLDVQKGYINSSSGLCINGDCKSSWVPDGKNDQYLKKILIYGGERDNTIRTMSQTPKTIKTIDGELMNFSSIICPVGTIILGDFFITYTDSITNGSPSIMLKYSDNGTITLGVPANNTQQTKYKTVIHKVTGSEIVKNNTDDMTLDISVFMGNETTEYFELSRIELGIYCGEEVALP